MNLLDVAMTTIFTTIAVAAATSYSVTDPKKRRCVPMPPQVRYSFVLIAMFGVYRAASFSYLAITPAEKNHADWDAVIAWAIIGLHLVLGLVATLNRRLSPETWEIVRRMGVAERQERARAAVDGPHMGQTRKEKTLRQDYRDESAARKVDQ